MLYEKTDSWPDAMYFCNPVVKIIDMENATKSVSAAISNNIYFSNHKVMHEKETQKTAAENQTWHQLISTGWKTKTYNNNIGECIERFQRFIAFYVSITSTSLSRSRNRKCAWRQHFVLFLKIGSFTKINVHVH